MAPTTGGGGRFPLSKELSRELKRDLVSGWGYSWDAFLETEIDPFGGYCFLLHTGPILRQMVPLLGCSHAREQRYPFRSSWPQEYFESDARRSRLPIPYSGGCGWTGWRGALFQECVFPFIFRMRCVSLSALLRLTRV